MENCSGLDKILKNTEFENTQQLKAIESEKEKIQAYKEHIDGCVSRITKLEEQLITEEEHAVQLNKQHAINKDNIESLKRTSSVLVEHEEALKKKLQCCQDELHQENLQRNGVLVKYEDIWTGYKAEYDTMEEVQELRSKKEELCSMEEHNKALEVQIDELEVRLGAMDMEGGTTESLKSWIVKIASLRVETKTIMAEIQDNASEAKKLKLRICLLQNEDEMMRTQQRATGEVSDFMEDMAEAQSSQEPREEAEQQPTITISSLSPDKYSSRPLLPVNHSKLSAPILDVQKCFEPVVTRKQHNTVKYSAALAPSLSSRYRLEMPQLCASLGKIRSENSVQQSSNRTLPVSSQHQRNAPPLNSVPLQGSSCRTQMPSLQMVSRKVDIPSPPEVGIAKHKLLPLERSHRVSTSPIDSNLKDQNPEVSPSQEQSPPKQAALSKSADRGNHFQFKVPKEPLNSLRRINTPVHLHASHVPQMQSAQTASKHNKNGSTQQVRQDGDPIGYSMYENMDWVSGTPISLSNQVCSDSDVVYDTTMIPPRDTVFTEASQFQSATPPREASAQSRPVFTDGNQFQSVAPPRETSSQSHPVFTDGNQFQSVAPPREASAQSHPVFTDGNQFQSVAPPRETSSQSHPVFTDGNQLQSVAPPREASAQSHPVFTDGNQFQSVAPPRETSVQSHSVFTDAGQFQSAAPREATSQAHHRMYESPNVPSTGISQAEQVQYGQPPAPQDYTTSLSMFNCNTSEGGLNFGGFGQDTGCTTASGGFGGAFFDREQRSNDGGGLVSFSGGASFGSISAQPNENSGFSFNFGSSNESSGSTFF